MDDLQDVINVRKAPSIWEKFGKAFNLNGGDRSASDDRKRRERGKPVEKTGVFGVSLEQQVEQYGVDSTFGVGPVPLRIPAFVDECISAMRQMDMSVEGVFRKTAIFDVPKSWLPWLITTLTMRECLLTKILSSSLRCLRGIFENFLTV